MCVKRALIFQKNIFLVIHLKEYSLVLRQKGESQNGGNKKTKHAKFKKNPEHFLPPDMHTHMCL